MTSSASPTVRRRRLAAELRRLRGSRTGTDCGQGPRLVTCEGQPLRARTGHVPAGRDRKAAGLLRSHRPPPRPVARPCRRGERARLVVRLRRRVVARSTWSSSGWRRRPRRSWCGRWWRSPACCRPRNTPARFTPRISRSSSCLPGVFERRVAVRMIRQQVLTTRNPPLELSAVIDESVLLRKVGSREVMFEQLLHLAEMSRLPNVELRILPLESETSLMADSFVVFGFSPEDETQQARRRRQHGRYRERTLYRRRD